MYHQQSVFLYHSRIIHVSWKTRRAHVSGIPCSSVSRPYPFVIHVSCKVSACHLRQMRYHTRIISVSHYVSPQLYHVCIICVSSVYHMCIINCVSSQSYRTCIMCESCVCHMRIIMYHARPVSLSVLLSPSSCGFPSRYRSTTPRLAAMRPSARGSHLQPASFPQQR